VLTEFLDGAAPDVAARVGQAAEALEAAGARVEEVSVPEVTWGLSAYYLIAPGEASSNLARYDGVRYGLRVDAEDTAAMNTATRRPASAPRSSAASCSVPTCSRPGTWTPTTTRPCGSAPGSSRASPPPTGAVDVLLGPTTPTTAFPLGEKTGDPLTMYLSDVCTIPSNLAGHPAISVPFGTGDDGLPIGVQLLGPALSEGTMLKVAAVVEAAAPVAGHAGAGRGSHIVRPGWEMVIGLEVHCELKTATKLFCGCPNMFGDEPNTNICPVCLGLPGSLPVINQKAVELAMAIGTALNCEIRPSTFHRKNYFYPDQAKDYQISQYDEPINVNGHLDLPDGSRVGIERAHMEEDTGKTTHAGSSGRIHGADYSLVDYNRSGVPLVEIVSAPDMRSSAQARAYATELRAVLVASGASDGKMEEGSMRVDANVSVRRSSDQPFGTRCEIKNLNSVRSLGRAIEYEAERQIALIEAGDQVVQQTRHWDEDAGRTVTLRSKEDAYDYRYFLEPDLVPLVPDAEWIRAVADTMAPMPAQRRSKLIDLLGGHAEVTQAQIDQVGTVVDLGLDHLMTQAVASGVGSGLALARTANEAATDAEAARRLGIESYVALLTLEASGGLTASQSKAVLSELLAAGGGDPAAIAAAKGFEAMSEDSLAAIVAEVVAAHPEEWSRFCDGDEADRKKMTGSLIGLVMTATSRRADARAVAAELQRLRG
jgi:aspartyl-tRNA(Asn)/glutamyl-tRNA(Gln) amidotransferase subunit B